jgi:hypothetical protein
VTAPPVTRPPCQHGYRCTDHDRPAAHRTLHTAACPMSEGMISRRQGRIGGLTPGEMRSALTFLSGWTPTGADCALGDADELRAAGVPEGAL